MNTQLITIRRSRQTDISKYAKARRKLWPKHGIIEFRRELTGLLKTRHFFSWLAIGSEGEIIGFIEASTRPYANGCQFSPVLFLEGIWVERRFRKQGVGDLLLKTLETFARKKRLKEIGSDCLLTNKVSATIHQKWKFKETMRVVYFRKELN